MPTRLLNALAGALLCALAVVAFAQQSSTPVAPLEGPALVSALRGGGFVLYLRHTSTDFGQNDDAMTDFANCAQQRNLTDAGRREGREIGAALRELSIPLGPILASPYCRTMESARLAFGTPTVSSAVRGGPAQTDTQRYAALRALLSTPVAKGSNLAIASHGNPFRAVAGPPHLAEGEIAVVEPLANGNFRVVARVPKDGWTMLK